ncbi:MAG: Lrp/AsnC family transcriptional regulator [Thaumarchaeota archaeon]|nr:Lrp/AsnC family transcriptional regulator [Nitrososphaerota archaeon]
MPVDELDRKILSVLLADSRLSYREVARRLRVATGTVVKRVKRMEEEGVIRNYSVTVDHEKLGYDLTVVTEITVSKGRLLEMEKEIARMPLTCAVYDVTGMTDAIIIAKFRGRKELSKFTKNLLSMPFVEHTNTRVVLTTVKEDFRLH